MAKAMMAVMKVRAGPAAPRRARRGAAVARGARARARAHASARPSAAHAPPSPPRARAPQQLASMRDEESRDGAWFILPVAGDETFAWASFTAEILGPDEYDPSPDAAPRASPFKDGLFRLAFAVPEGFPAAAPAVTFKTKLFHPLVNEEDGRLCNEFMASQWPAAGGTLRDALVIARRMLAQPHLNNDMCVNTAAKEMLGDLNAYDAKVKAYTEKYAAPA